MTRSIAYRRHQRERAIKHATRVIKQVWGEFTPTKYAYKFADNLKKCSCEMCQPGSSGRQVKRADAKLAWECKLMKENGYDQV